MKKRVVVLFLGLFIATFQTFAQQSNRLVNTAFLIEGGVEYGGDEILKVFFTNGEDQSIPAGNGAYLAIMGEMHFTTVKQLMLRASIGAKYSTTAADNANIMFIRFPIHITPFWKINDDFRLGVGVTTLVRSKLYGDGFFPDMAYKSTVGPRFEFGYKWFALMYSVIDIKDKLNQSLSANSVGASVSYTF